jgi:hypothetical protein
MIKSIGHLKKVKLPDKIEQTKIHGQLQQP